MKIEIETKKQVEARGDRNSVVPHGDFRRCLQETLVGRCKVNAAYSLRSFAKQLQIEPSFLSKLLSGKRRATASVILKISLRLGFSPEETNLYLAHALKNKKRVQVDLEPEKEFQNLAVDHFKMIADWYHYAILELTLVDEFDSSASWIAKKLGIKKIEAQAALERLERLEMLRKTEEGRYENTSGSNTTVGNEFTAVAFRKLQKQILLQALEALENTSIDLRDQSSMTMSINPELIPAAKDRIKKFRRELCTFLQDNNQPKKQVYQLSVSLFPVTDLNIKGAVK